MQEVSIKDAPAILNINDRAMWVTGYNEAVKAMQCQGCDVPKDGLHQIAEPAAPLVGQQEDFKRKVYESLGIGSACDEHVVFINIENLARREQCLSAIEREFFMVKTPPNEEEGETEPCEECLLNWGHTPEQYVKQFAEALATNPTQQGLEKDAALKELIECKHKMSELIARCELAETTAAETKEHAVFYRHLRDMDWYAEPRLDAADGTVWKLTMYSPQEIVDASDDDSLDAAIRASLAAQAKQGEQANG